MSSDLRPKVRALLGDGASDGGASHLSLGVDDDTSVVFEIEIVALSSSVGLSLPNNNCE